MRRLGRAELIKTGKIAVGCCLAYTAASLLGLRYATSAVTITLLSIQNTRRDTFRLAGRRSCAFLTALAVSFAVFSTAGYTVLSLGVFLLVFALLCHLFGLMDGLSMSTVLVLHFWSAGAMTLSAVLNELILMAIGIVMGIVMNLYMPRELDAIRADQRRIDETVREILIELSERVVASSRASTRAGAWKSWTSSSRPPTAGPASTRTTASPPIPAISCSTSSCAAASGGSSRPFTGIYPACPVYPIKPTWWPTS